MFLIFIPSGKLFHIHDHVPYITENFICTVCGDEVPPLIKLEWFQYRWNYPQ